MRNPVHHGDGLSGHQTHHMDTDRGDKFGKDEDDSHDSGLGEHSSNAPSAQAGVRRIEAVSKAWTKTSLIIAYVTLLIIANVTSLEIQVTSLMAPFATSAFSSHSLVSTIYVVQGVVSAVIKPPMGKIADVFGRLESFSITVFLYTIGYIMQAGSNSVKTFAGAQIFWAAGFNGLQVLQQIFVADTTDLLNRALFATLFDVPFLWTTWAGPEVGKSILANTTWRWGYGIWAIILPICFIPLAVSLFMNQQRAKKLGFEVPSPFRGFSLLQILKNLWLDLDAFGLLLFAAAISLILLPLTLAPNANGEWKNGSMIAMLVIGGVLLIAFPFWETSKKLAPNAFFPPELFKEKTIIAGVMIAFFYFMAFYMSVFPYFNSYLQIVQGQSFVTAGYITRVFTFSSTVSSIVVSLLIKYTAHYKYYVTIGATIYLLGMGLMLVYRTQDASVGTLVGTQIVIGIGGGFLNVPVQLGVQASASHQQVAAVTTVWLTLLEVGGAVGSAISGAIWSTYVPAKLQEYLPATNAADWAKIYGDLTVSSNYTTYPLGSPVRLAINQAYQETMRYLLIGALCCAAPILPLTFVLKNYKLDQMDQKVVGNVIGSAEKREKGKSWRFWKR
ncbi:ProP Permease of the major facilitator superfamily [Pyrenophora tritici-repentis]|uniref:ProP, Permease major facilitator superfamily n=1 Tax=Pyrenophora tritici-repentis TaxID=45151 RepID=A0A2W1DC23_9PLEO|nr:TRI12 multi-domain protein [Pyrenophora tritici-repentis]KAF7450874.1 TRI12 multi-domain protein [Pyrenophora tritici-repentis]KAF7573536.1 ProP, Permease major facilitator superfamily [Pyrenophora tritici-repentis]KAI0570143.1 TRI12 multi-domain protein [Pyrenophora tritici-repentis]KAI0616915.1 TRI12 multi-domain protein [Pyrenophora tritici-repentis]